MLTNQGNKRATTVILLATSGRSFDYAYRSLTITRIADGRDQPPSDLELRNQGLRNRWSTSSDEYAIVWSMRCPTKRTVETFNSCVVDFQLANPSLRLARKIADAFDCINLRGDHRQHGSLVPEPAPISNTRLFRSSSSNSVMRATMKGCEIVSICTDRQRVIAIGSTLQCLRHEEVAWYVSDCFVTGAAGGGKFFVRFHAEDSQASASATAQSIAGSYDLYGSSGTIEATMHISGAGPEFTVSGSGWSGNGRFENGSGYYNWRFGDGRTGTTTLSLDPAGNLIGTVAGSGINWTYVGRRREGPIVAARPAQAGACWTITGPNPDGVQSYFNATNGCAERRECWVRINGREPRSQVNLAPGGSERIYVAPMTEGDRVEKGCTPAP